MSVTPTPSVSSDQTRYYDAVVMQFSPHTDDATGEGQGSRSADPRPGGENGSFPEYEIGELLRSFAVSPSFAAPENSSGTNQPSHTEETGSPSKRANDEAGQKPPSLRSLPTEESDGQEKQTYGLKTLFGGTGNALGRRASARTTASTRTTTSAFANGAPLTGPNAEPDVDENILARGANAERSLSQKQKDRITKEESAFLNRDVRMMLR